MTPEEAIETLELAISEVEWEYPMDIAAAIDKAILALRAQAEAEKNEPLTLDGCEYCADPDGILPLDWMYGLDHIFPNYRFCPMCGRELRRKPEEAHT